MSADELSRQVALACGWTETRNNRAKTNRWCRPGVIEEVTPWNRTELPDFEHSLDACFGPGGPIEYATAQGWAVEQLSGGSTEMPFRCRIYANNDAWMYRGQSLAKAYADSPSEALCRAFLAAQAASMGDSEHMHTFYSDGPWKKETAACSRCGISLVAYQARRASDDGGAE